MYRRTSNMVGLSYPASVISVLKVLTCALTFKKKHTHKEKLLGAHIHAVKIDILWNIYMKWTFGTVCLCCVFSFCVGRGWISCLTRMVSLFKCFSFIQNVDKWSFDVFALNEASGDHALKFIFYELLTRYDLISRFKVKPQGNNVPPETDMWWFMPLKQEKLFSMTKNLHCSLFDGCGHTLLSTLE